MQAVAGKPRGRRQTEGSGFAMTKRSTCHSHILSAFLFPIAVAHTVLFGLCMCFDPISSYMSFLSCHLSFIYCLWFIYLSLLFFLLCFPIDFSPCFSFPSVSFSSAPLLCHSFYVALISTFSWAACKGQLVGCNHPGYIQMGARLQLPEALKPLHPPGTPWLWESKGPAYSSSCASWSRECYVGQLRRGAISVSSSGKKKQQLSFFFREVLILPSHPNEAFKVQ